MQSPILAALLLLCAAVYSANGYTTKFDNINMDEILNNDKLLNFYVQCLLGRKTCNAEGQTLKDILPDALQTRCSKCNDKQKEGALKAIKVLEKKYPEQWKLLLEKWDPTGEFFKAFKIEQEAYFQKH